MKSQKERNVQRKLLLSLKKRGIFAVKIISANLRGVADVMVIHNCRIIFIELKANNNKQSIHQIKFAEICRANNIEYWVVNENNIDDVIRRIVSE